MQNIEAKRYLERSFYTDKPKERFLLGLEDQTVYAKDLERFYFLSNKTLEKECYTVRIILRTSWIESQTVYTKRLLNDFIFWKFPFLT